MASLMPQGKQQYFDSNGNVLSGGKLYTYQSGTTTPLATYSDQAGATPNANPVVLNARGEATIFWGSAPYKAKLTDASDVEIWTQDNMYAQADASAMASTTSGKGASLVSINDAGSYYSSTTVEGALQEIVGRSLVTVKDARFGTATGDGVTSDQAAVAAAVSYCYSNGDDLWWPDGTYLTTATVANLHDVRHRGPGVVKRGSDLFYVDSKSSQSNTLYIATTGDNANDGLSSSQPRLTFQSAFDALKNYGPVLEGTWTVQADAGTYTISGGSHNHTTPSKNRVVIKGPTAGHPNVPTCLVDGGGNGTAYYHGINCDGPGVRVQVQDIKVQNFTEASGNTRIGLLAANGADLYTTNVHGLSCSWTALMAKECEAARISGGILDANSVGAYCCVMDSTRGSFGYGSLSTVTAPQVKNSISAGVYWSTGSQGHIDYITATGNGVAVLVAENSRADIIGGDYDVGAGNVGIRAITGGMWGSGGAAPSFTGAGTYLEAKGYSGNINELDDQGSGSWQRVAFDRTTRSLSGVTPTTLTTPYTIAAYRLLGVGKSCKVHVFGVWTALTAGSTITVNFGGMALAFTVPGAATNVAFEIEATLHEVAGGYRAFGKLSQGLTQVRHATATAGFNNAASQDISVAATLANAGDSMAIYRTDVFLIG